MAAHIGRFDSGHGPMGEAMKIEMRSPDSIKPYEKNPRKNDGAVKAVAESIRQFGFRQPVVVDAKGVIIVGHTRWKAAKELGLKKIPVHVADLKPAAARAYRIADNKVGELAQWDDALLKGELEAIREDEIDLSGIGFSELELSEKVKLGFSDIKKTLEQDENFLDIPYDLRGEFSEIIHTMVASVRQKDRFLSNYDISMKVWKIIYDKIKGVSY